MLMEPLFRSPFREGLYRVWRRRPGCEAEEFHISETLSNGAVTAWRVLRERLHSEAQKLSVVRHLEQWAVCTPLSVHVFVTLATQ
jgi:hypothetical protein